MNKPAYKQHWENVFENKEPKEVSWFQERPHTSITLFEKCKISVSTPVIDVGCGDSKMIDYWLSHGYKHIHALDVSNAAIERLKKRIGHSEKLHFHISNIVDFAPKENYHFWNDRAVFHFLTDEKDIKKYITLASESITKGGYLSLATFSKNGPLKCSGIPISQYNTEDLQLLFKSNFKLVTSFYQDHPTPFDTVQNFCFALFRKVSQH